MPSDFQTRFLVPAGGDESRAAALLAQGLMQDDPAQFKVGYTRPNAVLAACKMFPDADQSRVEEILALIEPDQEAA